jgi:hypothetical protein
MPKLSPQWQSLLKKLWEHDGQSISRFLPEIIDEIKSTKSRSMAELGLLNVLHSPKVRDMPLRLLTPGVVEPGHQAMNTLANEADLPLGKVRNDAIEKILGRTKLEALSEGQILEQFAPLSEVGDEASKKRGQRARLKSGHSRPRGAPRRTGQK